MERPPCSSARTDRIRCPILHRRYLAGFLCQGSADRAVRPGKLRPPYTGPTDLTPALLREFVEKVVVHASDKSSGRRVQRIDVHYTFIGEIDLSPEYSKYEKETTA